MAALLFACGLPVRAADAPAADNSFVSLDKGFHSESPFLNPGKLDFLYRYRKEESDYNLFAWTPVFKGGAGLQDPDGKSSTRYAGGYVRPLFAWPDKGELILGAQGVDYPKAGAAEFQGEYRFPFGLGVGGGLVDGDAKNNAGNDVAFGKLDFRNQWKDLHYIFELQAQEFEHHTSPGGYMALYNDSLMGVGGYDGEQWRATIGFISPWTNGMFRPTFEVLYVDNSIGDFKGPKTWFANATLGYSGGFLSNPARLGRAMGPQGLEFGNPLGFLVPTWNRRLEVWEMGSLVDGRAESIKMPNGTTQERYEGLFFPFQFAPERSFFDYLFLGGSYTKNPTRESPGAMAGVTGKIGFLLFSLGVEQQFHPDNTTVVVGLIDPF